MRIFASDRVKNFMKALGMQSGEAIEHRMVTNAIEKAQRKVEGRNFDIRKQLLEFDDVNNEQRKVIYHMRNTLLAADNIGETIADFRQDVLNATVSAHIPPQSLPEQWDVAGVVGAMMADQLAAQGHSVIMLEAGLRIERGQAVENWRNMPFENRVGSDFQGLYPQAEHAPAPLYFPKNNYVELSGPSGSSFQQGYLRTVGGTTWHWAASCWRHLPSDMRMKSDYGVGRDWAISYDELEPYYCRAEQEMGVAGPNDPALQSPTVRR